MRAKLDGAKLKGANLYGANFREASLCEADLSETDLRDSDLSTADLRGASFYKGDLSRATLNGANLRGATLHEAKLVNAHLCKVDLRKADLGWARLHHSDFTNADLSHAYLWGALLFRACLNAASLEGAELRGADLSQADLRGANLRGANLICARMLECKLDGADISECEVYGVSVWDASLEGTTQLDLIITHPYQPKITVDNLEVAQFVYLLLNNAKIRVVIDTITSKVVLILGRFTPERKPTLDALRNALRTKNYLPIVFDFERPKNRDVTETVSTLAHMARFVIADLTDPRSIPQELTAIVPRLLSVPVRPLLLGNQKEWGMFGDLARYPQVIEPMHYTDDDMLLGCLESDVIGPAERKAEELTGKR